MHHDRFPDDRIFATQTEFAFPIEVRFSRRVGFDVAEIASVMIEIRRTAVMFHCRIEMRAGRSRVWRRAIAFFVNVKTVFARFEILNVGDDLDFIAHFCESDCADNLTARFGLQLRACFRDFLRLRKTSHRAKHCYEENRFHAANVRRFFRK